MAAASGSNTKRLCYNCTNNLANLQTAVPNCNNYWTAHVRLELGIQRLGLPNA